MICGIIRAKPKMQIREIDEKGSVFQKTTLDKENRIIGYGEVADENYMTTRPGVFAAGDVVTGAKTVVHAVEAAKNAAQAMICYMNQSES